MTVRIPSPADVSKLLDKTGMSSKEFGEAIGYGDAERVTRALVKGERHGRAYSMSATAAHALVYMMALSDLVAAHENFRNDATPENEEALVDAQAAAIRQLPTRLRPND
jgi:hypothetical protein